MPSDTPPIHPFPDDSATAVMIGMVVGLLGRGATWRYGYDRRSWTAHRNEPDPDGTAEHWLRVEDGSRHGDGPVVTAVAGDNQTVLRFRPAVQDNELGRGISALRDLGVLPGLDGRYT